MRPWSMIRPAWPCPTQPPGQKRNKATTLSVKINRSYKECTMSNDNFVVESTVSDLISLLLSQLWFNSCNSSHGVERCPIQRNEFNCLLCVNAFKWVWRQNVGNEDQNGQGKISHNHKPSISVVCLSKIYLKFVTNAFSITGMEHFGPSNRERASDSCFLASNDVKSNSTAIIRLNTEAQSEFGVEKLVSAPSEP